MKKAISSYLENDLKNDKTTLKSVLENLEKHEYRYREAIRNQK
jgi:hypothetical protein